MKLKIGIILLFLIMALLNKSCQGDSFEWSEQYNEEREHTLP